jgi:hypothetical protein
MIEYLKPKLKKFVIHNFVAKWQEKELKAYVPNLPPNTIVSCIDFFDNYAFKVQNKIQHMHWFSFQITILVHITYHRNLTFNPTYLKSRILKEIHYYISDKKDHDTLFVQQAFKLNWEFLNKISCFPKCHVVWSHGCSGQFKFARCWYFLLWYHNMTICEQHLFGCQMVWNYFYSGHGKGEVDGARALLKREVHKKQIKPNARWLQSTSDVVTFLWKESTKQHATHPNARRTTHKYLWEVKKDDVDRHHLFECHIIHGNCKAHQVCYVSCQGLMLVEFQDLFCSCPKCEDGDA